MKSIRLTKIQTTNFRNLDEKIISFSENINCIFGDNGNGKTNILEAIFVMLKRKSFRKNASFPQFLGMDGDKPEIYFSSLLNIDGEDKAYTGKLGEGHSEWFLNNQPCKKKIDCGLVFINPFDSYDFHNSPSARRNWFDQYISLIDPVYKAALNKYNTALKHRNTLLKKKPMQYLEQVNALDRERAKLIVQIIAAKAEFLNQINRFCGKIFKTVFSEEHVLFIELESIFKGNDSERNYQILCENLKADEQAGFSKVGTHRDDYMLLFDGLNSYDYCSLGQQKMSYISLLFAYIELFRYKFSSFPIVLIDDVSGELDIKRWQNLVGFLNRSEFQVFITTANDKFKKQLELLTNVEKIEVKSGIALNI